MKRAFIWISSALLSAALLLMGGANAPAGQEPYPCGPGYGWRQEQGFFRGQQAGPHFMRRFETIDQDHDGVVTVEEAAGNVEFMFSLMDEDEDNSLSLEEFMSVRMGSGAGYNPSRQEAAQARKEARFGDMDVDGNGLVDKREFMTAGEKRFLASDADGNGQVTPWEFRASRRRF